MENKIIIWAIALILMVSVIFNIGNPTGNVVSSPQPIISIPNNQVMAGSVVDINIRNMQSTTQEFYILDADKDYTGERFFSRSSRCDKVGKTYECNLQYRIPISALSDGKYYVQAKDRKGILVGNTEPFIVSGSK